MPSRGSLGDEPSLEVRDGAEDMEHELAGGRGGVEALLEAHQVDARALRVSTVSSSSRSDRPQAVEPSDAETIPGPGVIHELGESWALKAFSGNDVDEHPDGAGFDESDSLIRA